MGSGFQYWAWPRRLVLGATVGGGILTTPAPVCAEADPFRVRALPAGYMLAADRFVPSVSDEKKDQEGALCAGEMGSDRDKYIEEGRCAYTDPDEVAPEEKEEREGKGQKPTG
ncbi:hypothetical protein [Thiohalorhabdus methylotrophus]|uniref:Secreted protein n=1 Tax=Thiohalorhabdus methylotrophus TaxID=3242694 RepID=A0ABV4TWE4_9GAMM